MSPAIGALVTFSTVALVGWTVMTVAFRAFEGRWPQYLDFSRPAPSARLVIDLLADRSAWKDAANSIEAAIVHPSGVRVEIPFLGNSAKMSIAGQSISLSDRDAEIVARVMREMLNAGKAEREEAALIAWGKRVQQQAENVIDLNQRRRA